MELTNISELIDAIKESEYVLIGIGEEFEINAFEMLADDKMVSQTSKLPKSIPDDFFKDLIFANYYNQYDRDRLKQPYLKLFELIKDKNYFLISVNEDRLPIKYGFHQNKTVFPCGGYINLQCSDNCQDAVIDSKEYIDYYLQYFDEYNSYDQGGQNELEHKYMPPKCPFCGKELSFNHLKCKKYCEAGYQDGWEEYLKFLQKTINHSLCVLELGVSDRYPTVIRSPFEKTVFFNKKSKMFRIHSYLGAVPENIQDKCYFIKENALDFMNKI